MSGAPLQVAYSLAHTYLNQIISSYSLRTYNASVMNYHLLCQGVVYPILTFEPFNALSRYGCLSGLEKARTESNIRRVFAVWTDMFSSFVFKSATCQGISGT